MMKQTRLRRRKRCDAFTLLELLIVVGIVVVLAGLLLPSLARVRESARTTHCANNMRQLMNGFLMFAAEHEGHLPGNYFDSDNPDPERRGWLLDPTIPFDQAPQKGTLFRYMNQNYSVYLCPSRELGVLGSKRGSNGRFDYSSFPTFSWARVGLIKPQCEFKDPANPAGTRFEPTPIIVEEDERDINFYLDAAHCVNDQISRGHNGRGHYATVDGSVILFDERPGDATWWNVAAAVGH